MDFMMKYQIAPRYLTRPSRRRPGVPITPGVKFVVAHDTGNPNARAAANVAYYERSRNQESASAHLFVDDTQILECVPALTSAVPEKAWHVLYAVPTDNQLFGYDANDAALGVEYCYGSRIDADEAYRKYVWVIAYACFKYQLDPARSVVGHFFLDPERRTDPVTGLAQSRRTYEQFLRDVVVEHQECSQTFPNPTPGFPTTGRVVTLVRLNARRAPNLRAIIHQTHPAGTILEYDGVVMDGQPVNGNPVWLKNRDGSFVWSGGVRVSQEAEAMRAGHALGAPAVLWGYAEEAENQVRSVVSFTALAGKPSTIFSGIRTTSDLTELVRADESVDPLYCALASYLLGLDYRARGDQAMARRCLLHARELNVLTGEVAGEVEQLLRSLDAASLAMSLVPIGG